MATVPEDVAPEVETHRKPPFLRRVRIRNYKSIKFCDVTLEPLTVLVGRNGSGKSNFVDALAFLRDVVTWGTEKAVQLHGGPTLRHRLVQEPVSFDVEYDAKPWRTDSNTNPVSFRYGIELIGIPERPRLSRESLDECESRKSHIQERYDGHGTAAQSTKLSFHEGQARPLKLIQDYNFDLREMRRPQPFDVSPLLAKSGVNLANALRRIHLSNDERWAYQRVQRYLSEVVPEVRSVESVRIADHDTVKFNLSGGSESLSLYASSMSDGTLRVLATLVAAYQSDSIYGPPSLVAIEEPETSLHPAAMHALVDALDEATGRTQILLTTHSTELLDNPTIQPENVRVVEMVNGETVITPVDDASVEIVKRQLDTLGGLERQNQLSLNLDDQERQQKLAAGSDAK